MKVTHTTLREFCSACISENEKDKNNVISLDSFKTRKAIKHVQQSFGSTVAKQNAQEKEINKKLLEIEESVNQFISIQQLFMQCPTVRSENQGNKFVFHIFAWHNEFDEQMTEELSQFTKANIDKFEQAIDSMQKETIQLEKKADTMEWAAPWRRYTQWPFFQKNFQSFVDIFDKLKK